MTTTRTFDLATVLAVSHRLPIEGTRYREIMEHLTGTTLAGPGDAFRWRRICVAWVTMQHPVLQHIVMPEMSEQDYTAQDQWVEEIASGLGQTLPIAPLPPDTTPDTPLDVLTNKGRRESSLRRANEERPA